MPGTLIPFGDFQPKVAESTFVAPSAMVIGNVEIGANSSVWFGCVLRGDVHEIRVGENTNIQDGTVVHVTGGLQGTYIGSNITIGHCALIHAATLEDGCFVGMRATVMDGAVVEHGAMVAAGGLVTPGKRVKSGQLWGGTPARFLRDLTEADYQMFSRSAPQYVELARRYLESGV